MNYIKVNLQLTQTTQSEDVESEADDLKLTVTASDSVDNGLTERQLVDLCISNIQQYETF